MNEQVADTNGIGAQLALEEAGIRLYAGVQGSADEAAKELVDGTLKYETQANCDHEMRGRSVRGSCGETEHNRT